MRVLCLHGVGMSANVPPTEVAPEKHSADSFRGQVLQTQLAPVLYNVRKTHELDLCFVDGPNPAPAAIGLAEQYEGPYYRFYDDDAPQMIHLMALDGAVSARSSEASTPEQFVRKLGQHGLLTLNPTRACDFAENLAEQLQEGPFDGLLGFSEGASVAASLLLRQAAEKPKNQFKFAIFLCGTPPHRCQDGAVILADESSARITLPTAHIVGSSDPCYQASLALYNLCDGQMSRIYDHGKSHTIPWDPRTTQGIARQIQEVIQMSLESGHSNV